MERQYISASAFGMERKVRMRPFVVTRTSMQCINATNCQGEIRHGGVSFWVLIGLVVKPYPGFDYDRLVWGAGLLTRPTPTA